MKTNKLIAIVVLAAVVVALGIAQAETAGKVLYRLHPQKGKKYFVKMVTDQQITQTMTGQEQSMEQTMGMGMDFDINDVNDRGDVWVRYTFRWAMFRQKSPMDEIVYDSSQKDVNVPPQAQGFAALLNGTFAVKLTPEGKALQVEGLDKMRDNVSKQLPAGPMRESMLKGMEEFLSEETMKEFTQNSFTIYPDKEVSVGDSWTKTILLTQGLPMMIENKWTLKDRKDGVATLDSVSEIKPNPNAKPMEMGQMKMTYELTGTQQGQVRIDEATGLMLTSKLQQQISGQMKMQNTGPQPQEMTMPVKIKGVVTMEMTERKEGSAK